MSLPTISGSYHGSTIGSGPGPLTFSATAAAGDQLLLIIQAQTQVSIPFSIDTAVFGAVSFTRVGSLQGTRWRSELWVIKAPVGTATVSIDWGANDWVTASCHSIAGARDLLLSGTTFQAISQPPPESLTITSGETPGLGIEAALGIYQIASIISNQTFTIDLGDTQLFADNSVATTDIHIAASSGSVPLADPGRQFQTTLSIADANWFATAVTIAAAIGTVSSGGTVVQVDPTGFVVPAATTSPDVTPNGTAWNNSAWVQLAASADTDWLVTGLNIEKHNTAAASNEAEVDIGIGGAGSETVITTFRLYIDNVIGEISYAFIPSYIPVDAIPSGSRVSVRMRKGGTNTAVWSFAMAYLKKSSSSGKYIFASAKPTKAAPAAGSGTLLANSGIAWTNGAWAAVITSTSTAIVLEAVSPDHYHQNALPQIEFDIGVGGIGSEVVITTLRVTQSGLGGGMSIIPVWPPLDAIPASSRVSMRMRCNDIQAGIRVSLVYKEKPL